MSSPAVDVGEAVRLRIAEQARDGARRAVLALVAREAATYGATLAVVLDGLLAGRVSPGFAAQFDEQVKTLGIPRADVLDLARELRERDHCELADLRVLVGALGAADRPPSTAQANELVAYAKRVWRGARRAEKLREQALALVQAAEQGEAAP